MKWDKLRVTRDDCSIVKHRMVRCGLPLYGQPDSAADMAVCCAALLRAARRDGLVMDAGSLMDAWARWRGLDEAALDLVKLELVLHYHGDLQAPWAEGIIDELGVIW